MKPEEIFKAIDKQGWNKMFPEGYRKHYEDYISVLYQPNLSHGFYSRDAVQVFHQNSFKLEASLADVWSDKTPKNACRCLAEIKVKKEIDSERSFLKTVKASPQYLLFLEKEIRHDLLCNPGDDWCKKINSFLGNG